MNVRPYDRFKRAFLPWTKTFADPRLCAAVVDRLTFAGAIIETGSTLSTRPRRTTPARPANHLHRLDAMGFRCGPKASGDHCEVVGGKALELKDESAPPFSNTSNAPARPHRRPWIRQLGHGTTVGCVPLVCLVEPQAVMPEPLHVDIARQRLQEAPYVWCATPPPQLSLSIRRAIPLCHNTSNRLPVKRGGTPHAAGVGL